MRRSAPKRLIRADAGLRQWLGRQWFDGRSANDQIVARRHVIGQHLGGFAGIGQCVALDKGCFDHDAGLMPGRAVDGEGVAPAPVVKQARRTLVCGPVAQRWEGGASVAVDLLPGSGGSLMCLPFCRALGLSLTDLPEVTVFAE